MTQNYKGSQALEPGCLDLKPDFGQLLEFCASEFCHLQDKGDNHLVVKIR